jgi:alpha-L-rhamnosidase
MVDVPWNLYTEYGDIEVLRENYSALCAHVSYIESMSHGYIASYGLGDWCAPFDGPAISVNMESFKCPLAVSDTAFFHSAVKMAEKCARLLGYAEDEKKYAELAGKVKSAFRNKFYDAESASVYGDCQSATAMMIYHGLANEEEIPALLEKLVSQIDREDGHLDFGILGCKAVMETLGRYGRADLGIKLLTNPTYPSMKVWLDMGCTTLFECWNGGGSRNQHMFSSVSAFFHKYVGGISASEAGYRKIDFRPAVETELSFAYASVNTPYGKTECGFEKKDGKTVINITVPSDCAGTLYAAGKEWELCAGKHVFEL